MSTETITAGQDSTISVGNGNNAVNVIGGSQDTITIGNGTNTLTVTGGTGDTITAGSGNDTVTVTGGADNTITAGNGNVTVVASGDQGDTITLGKGNDTVDLGADDTLNMGKGSELVVLPPSTPTLAVASITVSEDQTISLAGLGINAGLSAFGFGQENISGFAAADQLEFTTAQFANFAAVMADATQVGQNTVITDSSSDTITLDNVAKSTLAAKNFVFVNAGSSSGAVLVTVTGLPSDLGSFNGGTYTAGTGTWTGTAAQFDALTFNAGEETSAQLTVTATDTTTGYSISKTIALTVTPPAINIVVSGVAQEGQSLTAAVTVSNGDAFTYQWQSSSDGTHWNNIAGATGMNYLVQESDETQQLRVKITLTDDSYSVAGAATAAVLDAAPTVTVPIITGTAQEGQTLTASASSGQSDNPVTYAWYGSANPNTVLGTGATYVVQEGDENATIEVKATATNDNGVTISATSAATASVIDNAGISLALSVVGNGTVQQGQTLVATATITGDADDSTAPVTYQWQSSSDGGLTWANVGGAVAGNFANGRPSSFLQLSEANEGQQFRVQASFTDDTGQLVSTTSAPTVPTADITPEITIPFSYAADDLSIVKNVNGTPTQIYNDTFSQAPIASPTILSNGVPTPIVFITQGSTWTESGGKAIASSTGVALNPNISGSAFDLALLDTNTDPTSTLGLKLATTFTVSSTFDLTAPPTGGYGMELTDGTSTHGVDQLERLIVQRVNGNAVVELIQANLTTNTQTVLASHTLTAAELANNTQIEFQMSHVANTTAVTGTFELIDNGTVTSTTTFSPTASIFTNGIDWTRVDVGAFTSTGVGLNVAPGASPREGQALTASASTNDSDATLHYQWQESSNGTLWTNIGTDSSTYVVQESDEGRDLRVVASTTDPDNGQSASVTSATTGPVKDVAPAPAIPTESGSAIEGQTLTASSVTTGSDEPLGIAYQWQSSSDGSTWSNISAATGSTYVLQETDENQLVRVSETFSDDTGQSVTLSSAASASVEDVFPAPATPTVGGTAIEGQTLTASSVTTGSDEPLGIAYQWQSSSDGSTWSNISAATGSTYVLQETDENQLVRVSETFSDDTGQSVTLSSAASASVEDVFPAPAAPTAGGTAIEGQTLTASSVTTGSDEPLGIAYQWQSSSDGSTWSNISAATGSTYVLQETDENQLVRVSETFSDDTGQSVTLSSAASASVEDVFPAPAAPTAGGTAIEGQTLTASSVTTGSDEPLDIAYQWQSSSDGSTWSNISAATGSTYVLQETDENQLVRVSETFSDDTGQSVTLSSAASASVEDVFPAPAAPTAGGTAIEGQTLTASSVTTGSDEPLDIAYQWQSSSDGSTWSNISAATGSTYVLQETDENQLVRVSETFSDDTGQSVTLSSAATSAVLDNSSLSVSVSVVANGTVQQGQTLVATATVTGDADDSTAPVTYQWQSSSDGGLTWANVAATAGGNFNGVDSSFYQLAEGDEGKLFRAQASFTDDTGQPVSTASAATASVADVTPEITVPYSYAVDSLSIVKNGTQIYTNNFGQAPITSPTILSNGSPSPIIFITQGSTWTDAGGKAIASSAGAAPNPNVTGGNPVFDVAVLNTNTNQQGTGSGQSDLGLKKDAAFTTTAAFDLTVPTSGTYGTEFTDGTSSHGVDQLERLLVANDGHGNAVVELVQANLVTNTSTILASQTLTAAQIASNNQIELQFSHAAGTTQVTGAFALGNSGTFGALTTFTPAASIFTNGVTWTRVDIGAFTSAGVGLNVGSGESPREGQTLTASAATNDSDATLHYQWQESSNNFASFAAIGSDSSIYVVQESDEGLKIRVVASTTDADNGATASVTSAATGSVLDALPTVTTPTITGTAKEGQTLTASASSGQSDNPVTYAWYSSADGFTNPISTGSTYVVKEADENATIEAKATTTNDNGVTISATSVTSAVLDAAPSVTTPTITGTATEGQTLTASASSGQSDNPVTYAWYSSADGFTNPIGTGSTYVVSEGNEGSAIEVKATATNDNGVQVSATSAATGPASDITLEFATAASISGTAQEGQVLTAVNGTLNDGDAAVTGYQWTRDGGNINGATSSSYAVTDTDEGHVLAVVETGTDSDGGPAATSTSAATVSVAGKAEAPTLSLASGFVTLTYPGAGPSGDGTFADGINNAGAIVGGAATDSQHTTGWKYVNGTFSAVGVAGAQDNNADGINNSGVIAGFYSPVRSTPRYGFVDNNGSYSQINVSPGISTTLNGINDSGVTVGASYLKNGTVYTGFIDNGGTFTYLNAPGTSTSAGYTNANDINNAGEVVGTYNINYNSGNAWQGFTYQNGTYTTIDDPNGTEGTFANGINNSGEIVGDYTDSSGKQHGFVDVGGTFITIDDPLGTGGTVLTGINDVGQVVGYYQDSSGIYHGLEASFQAPVKAAQNTSNPITGITLSAGDSDDALSMTLNVVHGSLALSSSIGLTVTSNGTNGTLSFSGSQSNINADLATLRYTPASGYFGSDTLSIHGTATEANGNAATTTQSLGITVAPNLIVNGGFETGTTAGWTITNGGSVGFGPTTQTGVDAGGTSRSGISPHSGTYEMHLGTAGSNGMLDQNVATVAGATYRIDFFLAGDTGTPSNFSASFGGVSLMSLVNTGFQNWTEYTFYKVATGTTTDLNFTSRQDPNFWFLDDVSVVDPEVAASDTTIVQTGPTPSVFDNGGSLTVADGTSMALSDVVDNTGSIALSAQSAATGLVIGDQAVLEGGGTISLSDSALNSITGNGTNSELSNVDNTIVGSGEIGGGGLSLLNKSGLIEATGGNPLVIDTGSNHVINTGTLEANGGSLIVKSAVTGGGNAVIAGGTLEFAGAADNNVSFSGSNLGILALDQSQSFTGTIAGFGGQDQIDLGDIGFAAGSTLGYAANSGNTGGTLTVSDGTNTANIALLGQYMASSFATASDGHGGTLISDPPAVAQNQLTQSHG